jgi:ElaB/YqjD/DUF883 family membrane-anchored ribosome-binding protein
MAIGAAISGAAKAAKSLIKKKKLKEGLKKAVNVTSEKTSALKTKAKEAASKAKPTLEKAKAKVKPAVKKVKSKTEGIKAKATSGMMGLKQKAKPTVDKVKEKIQPSVDSIKEKVGPLATGIKTKSKDFVNKNPMISGAIAGTLATSILASSAKSSYVYKKLPDGDIEINLLGDKSKSKFISPKQLSSPKDIDDIRTNIAVLESIVTSDDPQSQKERFRQTVEYLNNKYGIHEITGKDLSIKLPKML